MKDIMNLVNQIQETTRHNRLKSAYEIYKEMKVEIITNILIKAEQEIISAMLEGYAYTNVQLTHMEFSHNDEIREYFEDKGFRVYCDKFYNEDGSKEYFIHISWASNELNLQ